MTLPISIDTASAVSAQRQLCEALKAAIEAGKLSPGAKLDSLRSLSDRLGLSRHVILTAYEELVGMGLVEVRHGSGYYVRPVHGMSRHAVLSRAPNLEKVLDVAFLIQGLVEPNALLKCGSGALPKSWLQGLNLHRHLRSVAAQPAANVYCYGSDLGYLPLREVLMRRLEHRGITCAPEQILLTAGATHSLELLIRCLCERGDTVLVENPGYYNLFSLLHLSGVGMRAVPRRTDGPDLDALEALLRKGFRPKVYFMQSLLHNPTGSSISLPNAHRLLLLAEKYDFLIVEDDIYSDLAADHDPRLASLDALRRVVYLSGFTKTISADLRVGYIVAEPALMQTLGKIKLLVSITTSEFVEQTIYHVLTQGHYDRHVATLRHRLASAQQQLRQALGAACWHTFADTRGGMFIWTRHPAWPDSLALARAAATAGFWFAPGSAFDPDHRPSAWTRFNVAYSSPELIGWLTHRNTSSPSQASANN